MNSVSVPAEIRLTNGSVMLVDAADYEYLRKFSWFPVRVRRKIYAACTVRGERFFAHRLISGATDAYNDTEGRWRAADLVDHVNGNGLDNQRANLRIATRAENQRNTVGRPHHRISRFKGVSFYIGRKDRPWRATIEVGGRQRHLGYFETEEAAAVAYDEAALSLFAEFAFLNRNNQAT